MSLLEIKKVRKSKGYSQGEFSKMVGISRATLSKVENGNLGKVSAVTLENILSTLGYTLDIKVKNPFVRR